MTLVAGNNWGEPERTPHSRVLKVSVCALLEVVSVCLLLAPVVRGQFLCGRASCFNVKVVSSSLLYFYLIFLFFALQKPLWCFTVQLLYTYLL